MSHTIPASIEHRHSADSGCLTTAPALFLGKLDDAQHPILEPRAGWWRCERLTADRAEQKYGDLSGTIAGNLYWYETPNGYLVHEHDGSLFAHEPRTRCGFPGGAA